MNQTGKSHKVHQGRNIKRLREMQQIKQEHLAYELGEGWSQKKVSQLEAKEEVEQDILEQVAKILHVTPETIQKLEEDAAVNMISNNFSDFKDSATASSTGPYHQGDLTFNPIEKVIELYERLLQSEREKNELLRTSKEK